MLVGFTGAQCTGKTTLLTECKYSMDSWNFVDEVTRKVMRDGHNINLSGDDMTQLFILNEHLINHTISTTDKNMMLDRCILDGYVYTSCLSRRGLVSEWITSYACNLMSVLVEKLDYIFYTQPEDVPLVPDGTRSVDIEFRQDIINRYEDLFAQDYYWMDKVVRLSGDVEDRMDTIYKTLNINNNIWKNINENSDIRQQQNH